MKVIVAGGRNFLPSEEDKIFLSEKLTELNCTEVVYGECRGADMFGKEVADSMGIPTTPFPANWTVFGDAAGPIRNEEMAKYADAVILFPGNEGTLSMLKLAKKYGLKIIKNH